MEQHLTPLNPEEVNEILSRPRPNPYDDTRIGYVPIGNCEISIIYLHRPVLSFETAIQKDGAMVEYDEIGYEDVQRFDSIEKVNAELRRLTQCEILYT